MKRRIVFLVISALVLALVGGCGTKDNADYDVSKHLKLGQYKGIEVQVTKLEVTDEDVEAAIQADLEANSKTVEVTDRAVEDGDIVNIDYEGLKDGVAFENGTAQGEDLTIGSNSFIPGFEEKLVGAKVGDNLELDLTFPEEYPSEELAGQDVVFKVKVNAIKQKVVPEYNLDYVKENTDFDTIEAYEASIRDRLKAENEETMKSEKINSVFSEIVENSEVKSYPESLIKFYTDEINNYYQQYATMYGMELKDFLAANQTTEEQFQKESQEYAQNMAKQEMILSAIIKAENIKLTDKEFEDGINKLYLNYQYDSPEAMIEQVGEEKIRESLLWQKTLEFVATEAVEK